MSYSAKQWRAINWLIVRDGLTPQLSAYPMIRFANKAGEMIEHNVGDVVAWYDQSRKQDVRAKKRGVS